jgi:hypothetical protein
MNLVRHTVPFLLLPSLGALGCGEANDAPATPGPAMGAGGAGTSPGPAGPKSDSSTVPPAFIVIVADTDRDGDVDDDDRSDRGSWSWARGAFMVANLDDDDGDGQPDTADGAVDGDADTADLAEIRVELGAEVAAAAAAVSVAVVGGTPRCACSKWGTLDTCRWPVRCRRTRPSSWLSRPSGSPAQIGMAWPRFARKLVTPTAVSWPRTTSRCASLPGSCCPALPSPQRCTWRRGPMPTRRFAASWPPPAIERASICCHRSRPRNGRRCGCRTRWRWATPSSRDGRSCTWCSAPIAARTTTPPPCSAPASATSRWERRAEHRAALPG